MNPNLKDLNIRSLYLDDPIGYVDKNIYPDSKVRVIHWSSEYYSELVVRVMFEAKGIMEEYPGVFTTTPQLSHEHIGYEVAIDSHVRYQIEKYFNAEISRVYNGDIEKDPLINAKFKMMNNLPYDLSGNSDRSAYFFSFEVEVLPVLDRVLECSLEDFARAFTPLKEFYEEEVLSGNFFKKFMLTLNTEVIPKVSKIIIERMENIPPASKR